MMPAGAASGRSAQAPSTANAGISAVRGGGERDRTWMGTGLRDSQSRWIMWPLIDRASLVDHAAQNCCAGAGESDPDLKSRADLGEQRSCRCPWCMSYPRQ